MVKNKQNKISVLDFIISVLAQHERELDKQVTKLERIIGRLQKRKIKMLDGKILPKYLDLLSETQAAKKEIRQKINSSNKRK